MGFNDMTNSVETAPNPTGLAVFIGKREDPAGPVFVMWLPDVLGFSTLLLQGVQASHFEELEVQFRVRVAEADFDRLLFDTKFNRIGANSSRWYRQTAALGKFWDKHVPPRDHGHNPAEHFIGTVAKARQQAIADLSDAQREYRWSGKAKDKGR